jgi:predicted transcriptional regulator
VTAFGDQTAQRSLICVYAFLKRVFSIFDVVLSVYPVGVVRIHQLGFIGHHPANKFIG